MNANEFAQMVTPRMLLLKHDGTTILLLDCVWGKESLSCRERWQPLRVIIKLTFYGYIVILML